MRTPGAPPPDSVHHRRLELRMCADLPLGTRPPSPPPALRSQEELEHAAAVECLSSSAARTWPRSTRGCAAGPLLNEHPLAPKWRIRDALGPPPEPRATSHTRRASSVAYMWMIYVITVITAFTACTACRIWACAPPPPQGREPSLSLQIAASKSHAVDHDLDLASTFEFSYPTFFVTTRLPVRVVHLCTRLGVLYFRGAAVEFSASPSALSSFLKSSRRRCT